jgi:hypothetical protein
MQFHARSNHLRLSLRLRLTNASNTWWDWRSVTSRREVCPQARWGSLAQLLQTCKGRVSKKNEWGLLWLVKYWAHFVFKCNKEDYLSFWILSISCADCFSGQEIESHNEAWMVRGMLDLSCADVPNLWICDQELSRSGTLEHVCMCGTRMYVWNTYVCTW